MREAILYQKKAPNLTHCRLCRHYCKLKPGQRGLCGVRENREGTLYTLVYDKVAAANADPIEKKPFFHFHPGSRAYSIATMGCNLRCTHCQNSSLSQPARENGTIAGRAVSPEEIVKEALAHGCRSISCTYTEPTVYAELALEVARAARDQNLLTTFVSNGYASPELIQEMPGLVDGANIDLKAFSEGFYKKVCGARLEGVKDSLRLMHAAGIWLEITTLLIPGLNDDPGELKAMARFIADLNPGIPWHISRYHPAYRMRDQGVTPLESLQQARAIGLQVGLRHVYTGNVPGEPSENTLCHGCGKEVIQRHGFTLLKQNLNRGCCPYCQTRIAGRFD